MFSRWKSEVSGIPSLVYQIVNENGMKYSFLFKKKYMLEKILLNNKFKIDRLLTTFFFRWKLISTCKFPMSKPEHIDKQIFGRIYYNRNDFVKAWCCHDHRMNNKLNKKSWAHIYKTLTIGMKNLEKWVYIDMSHFFFVLKGEMYISTENNLRLISSVVPKPKNMHTKVNYSKILSFIMVKKFIVHKMKEKMSYVLNDLKNRTRKINYLS